MHELLFKTESLNIVHDFCTTSCLFICSFRIHFPRTYSKFSLFYYFPFWVLQLIMLIFQSDRFPGYNRLFLFKTHYQNFLWINLTQLIRTSRLHPLHFVIFAQTPKSVLWTFLYIAIKISTFTSQMFPGLNVWYFSFQMQY